MQYWGAIFYFETTKINYEKIAQMCTLHPFLSDKLTFWLDRNATASYASYNWVSTYIQAWTKMTQTKYQSQALDIVCLSIKKMSDRITARPFWSVRAQNNTHISTWNRNNKLTMITTIINKYLNGFLLFLNGRRRWVLTAL